MSQSFEALCEFLHRNSGLVMDPGKRYLVESRVMPIVRRERLSSLEELTAILVRGSSPKLAKDVIEAMTINETYFFRDKTPFDMFRSVMLPKLLTARAGEKRLRLWSAAASTGQEAYSLAMIIEDFAAKMPGWRVEIIGTDLSEPIVEKARKGIYSQFEVQRGLPTPYLLRHFNQIGDAWQISEQMRSRVSFRQLNLMSDFTMLGRFDVIFCRNVLIYFEAARKADILNRMTRMLPVDGMVLLGSSESIIGLKTDLIGHPEHRGLLVRGGTAAAANGARPQVAPSAPAAPVPAAAQRPATSFTVPATAPLRTRTAY